MSRPHGIDPGTASRRPLRRFARPLAELLEDRRLMTVQFGSVSSLTAGVGPRGVAVGDFNGDNKMDFAVAEVGANDIRVMLGTGDGGSTAGPILTTGASPIAVQSADLNQDGKLDLVAANFVGNSVSVFLGNGDGTFGAKQDFTTGDGGAQAIAVADFDGDAKFDLAVANNGTGVVTLKGNGDGTFNAPVAVATLAQPQDVIAADLDGKGKLDLIVATNFNTTVLLNNGDGTFAAPVNYIARGSGGISVAVSDFNNDGKLDVVQSNGSNNTVAVSLGNGDGTLQDSTALDVIASPGLARGVVAADFDRDGRSDIAVAVGGGISVLSGNGNGTFSPFNRFEFGLDVSGLAGVDLNGDSALDLVGTDFTDGTIRVALNTSPPPGASISISDSLSFEGDSGQSNMVFPVTLSKASEVTVTLNYATEDDSAKAGSDYLARSGQVTFLPGETTKDILIPILGDTTFEPSESFRVVLSNAVGAPILKGTGVGTIVDEDQAGLTVAIGNTTVTEGNAGTVNATFTVTLSSPPPSPITVNYTTAPGTATEGKDFVATQGSLTFEIGETSKTIVVPVLGDRRFEGNEEFNVVLSGGSGATIASSVGTATIVEDDAAPVITITNVRALESDGQALVTVTLSGGIDQAVTVKVASNSTPGAGTATPGVDYTSFSTSVLFQPSDDPQTITVPISLLDDSLEEGDETIAVTLSDPTGGATIGGTGAAVVTIADDESIGVISMATSTITASEADGSYTITFDRTKPSTALSATYTIENGDGSNSQTFTVNFAAGEATKSVQVGIANDGVPTPNRTFVVTLRSADVGLAIGTPASTRVTVVDDDPAYVAAPTVVVRTKRGAISALVLQFGAALDITKARNLGAYRLLLAGKDKRFGTRDDKVIRLKSAVYNTTNKTVTLTPRAPIARTLTPRLTVLGTGPLALVDAIGRPIDGNNDGLAGGDAILPIIRPRV